MIYESSTSPIIFETANKDTTNTKYVSGELLLAKGDYENETVQLVKGSYIISKTKDYINTNMKLFGYSGFYKVSGLEKYNGLKNSFGFGAEGSVNINLKIEELRIGIGGSFGVATEFGDYYQFRKSVNKEGIIDSETGFGFFTFSLFPVIAYQFSESTIISTQINIGMPGLISPSIVLNNDDVVYWLSWIPNDENKNDYMGRRFMFGVNINLNGLMAGF